MATPRITHIQRERAVLNDLEASFPDFTGRGLVWTEVQTGHADPDIPVLIAAKAEYAKLK